MKAGEEHKVSEQLIKACDNHSGITNRAIAKGFGFYDIILLYEVPDYDFHLTEAGPIAGITASNSFLCFPYLGTNSDEIFRSLNGSVFSGLSFIKFQIVAGSQTRKFEDQFINYLTSSGIKKPLILGTIGWNEIIFILCSDNIQDIATELLRLNYDEAMGTSIQKTSSNIAINYTKLPKADELKSLEKVKAALTRYDGLADPIDSGIQPRVMISSQPAHYSEIRRFWHKGNFIVSDMLGDYDISVVPPPTACWQDFIAHLLFFRWSFRSSINSTSTVMGMRSCGFDMVEETVMTIRGQFDDPDSTFEDNTTKFEISELRQFFGHLAPLMANHFFTLNSLLQNPLMFKAYSDMSDYPKRFLEVARSMSSCAERPALGDGGNRSEIQEIVPFCGKSETMESMAMRSAMAIANGAQLRSYGIYGNVEHPFGGFSRLRGGVQRSLRALEVIPSYIFHRLSTGRGFHHYWYGFIIVEDPKFSHISEIITVPTEALWRPETWWALFHETAHVMLTRLDWVDIDKQNIRQLLFNKKAPDLWFEFTIELAAEVIGFKIGFFGDFNLYLEVLWQHLTDIEPTQRKYVDTNEYLLRTLFVEIFAFRHCTDVTEEGELEDELFLYKFALKHFEKVETIVNNYQRKTKSANTDIPTMGIPWQIEDKQFLAARYATTMMDLGGFLQYLEDCVRQFEDQSGPLQPQDTADDENTLAALECLRKGEVWWDDVACPEALIYQIVKNRHQIDFQTRIATVLTFWQLGLPEE